MRSARDCVRSRWQGMLVKPRLGAGLFQTPVEDVAVEQCSVAGCTDEPLQRAAALAHLAARKRSSARYGLQIPVEVSIFQLVAQVIDTVVPLIVRGCQM